MALIRHAMAFWRLKAVLWTTLVVGGALYGYLKLAVLNKSVQVEGGNLSSSRSDDVPLHVVYHVGPAKMGSTSIQIEALQKYSKEFLQDGYLIYDFRDASKLNACLSRDTSKCQSRSGGEWSRFRAFLEKAKRERKKVLISTENYWNHLSDEVVLLSVYRDVFQHYGFRPRIVLGYRPLFELWPSAYYQEYNHYCGYSHNNVRQIPPLLEYLDRVNASVGLRHPTYAARKKFQRFFADIVILSLGPKFIERFVCDVVIGASHACAAVIQDDKQEQERVQNHGHSLVFDRLAQAVRLQSISDKPCKSLSSSIRKRLMDRNQTSLDLPRVCLSASRLQWMYNQSVYYQREVLPNVTFSERDHRNHFEHALNTSLCEVDVEQVLDELRYLFVDENAGTRT